MWRRSRKLEKKRNKVGRTAGEDRGCAVLRCRCQTRASQSQRCGFRVPGSGRTACVPRLSTRSEVRTARGVPAVKRRGGLLDLIGRLVPHRHVRELVLVAHGPAVPVQHRKAHSGKDIEVVGGLAKVWVVRHHCPGVPEANKGPEVGQVGVGTHVGHALVGDAPVVVGGVCRVLPGVGRERPPEHVHVDAAHAMNPDLGVGIGVGHVMCTCCVTVTIMIVLVSRSMMQTMFDP